MTLSKSSHILWSWGQDSISPYQGQGSHPFCVQGPTQGHCPPTPSAHRALALRGPEQTLVVCWGEPCGVWGCCPGVCTEPHTREEELDSSGTHLVTSPWPLASALVHELQGPEVSML